MLHSQRSMKNSCSRNNIMSILQFQAQGPKYSFSQIGLWTLKSSPNKFSWSELLSNFYSLNQLSGTRIPPISVIYIKRECWDFQENRCVDLNRISVIFCVQIRDQKAKKGKSWGQKLEKCEGGVLSFGTRILKMKKIKK